jgi:hypothetical protein
VSAISAPLLSASYLSVGCQAKRHGYWKARILTNRRRHVDITLAKYVHWRNGVPLGAPSSLRNMLQRSLGARSFAVFWQYWNPIWGYYLAKYIYSPLRIFLPSAAAIVATFVCSGALHDLVAMLILGKPVFICTPWFLFLGIGVLLGEILDMDLSNHRWSVRATINILYVTACFGLATFCKILWESTT